MPSYTVLFSAECQNTQRAGQRNQGPPTSNACRDHVGYEAWTVNNSDPVIFYTQREVLLARLGRSHRKEEGKGPRLHECYCKQSLLYSCKHSTRVERVHSVTCDVIKANAGLGFRPCLTFQLSTRHGSCRNTGLTRAKTLSQSGLLT